MTMAPIRLPRVPRETARLVLAGVMGVYVAVLKWVYIVWVAPVFGYAGLRYVSPGLGQELLTWVAALLPVLWLPLDVDRPSRLPLWFQYLVVYVPVTTIPLYNTFPGARSVWPLVAAILAALVIVQALTALPRIDVPTLRITPFAFRVGVLVLAGVLVVPIVRAFGIPNHVPGLADVYDIRAEYRDTLASAGALAAYAVNWFGRIVAPLLLIDGVLHRKWGLALLGFLGAVFVFSLSGMKSIALSGFFLVGLRFLYRPGGWRMGVLLASSLTGVVVLSVLLGVLGGTSLLVSLFVRRALVIPGLLTGYYYQFFSTHPQTLLGSTFLRRLAGYPYASSPQATIGGIYFGDPATNANVNVWGDAFLNLGLGGIVAFAVVLGLLLWVFDGVASRRSAALTTLMLGIPSLVLTNAALTTTVLTDGLALTFILAALLPAAGQGALRPSTPR